MIIYLAKNKKKSKFIKNKDYLIINKINIALVKFLIIINIWLNYIKKS